MQKYNDGQLLSGTELSMKLRKRDSHGWEASNEGIQQATISSELTVQIEACSKHILYCRFQ